MPGPVVPTYDQPRVSPSELPGARVADVGDLTAFGGGQAAETASQTAAQTAGQASDIFEKEYNLANQAAHVAGSARLSQGQSDLQTRISQMKGQDALGSMDYFNKAWGSYVKQTVADAPNDTVRAALERDAAVRYSSTYKFVQAHTSEQTVALQNQQNKSFVENETNLAAQNAFDDDAVDLSRDRIEAVTQDQAAAFGVPKTVTGADGKASASPAYEAMLTNNLSPLHREVILARVKSGDGDAAREYLEANRDEMTGPDVDRTDGAVEGAERIRRGMDAYNEVRNMNLSNGEPNEAARERFIMNPERPGTLKEKMQAWDFVRARGNEDAVQMHRAQDANDQNFMNAAYGGNEKHVPLEQALDLVNRYGRNAYDRALKEQQIQRIYEKSAQTDEKVFMPLWIGIQNKQTKQEDIDKAWLEDGTLSNTDHRKLSEDYFKSTKEEVDPAQTEAWEDVKGMAREKIPDSKQRYKFLRAVKEAADGKSPEETIDIAGDKLKKVGGGFFGGSQSQYKIDYKNFQDKNAQTVNAFHTIGEAETRAIIEEGQRTKKDFGPADLTAFAQQYGGMDAIKQGTPVNNAIQSLMKHGSRIAPENIEWALKKSPDGKVPDKYFRNP